MPKTVYNPKSDPALYLVNLPPPSLSNPFPDPANDLRSNFPLTTNSTTSTMYGYASTFADPTPLAPAYGARSNNYPLYYPHPHLVPPTPAAQSAAQPRPSAYPAGTTFNAQPSQPGILRTPSRNRAAAAAALRARSATPAARARSRSASRRRVSFADGSRPGSGAASRASSFEESAPPRARVQRHRRTSSSSSNGSPGGRARRAPSRVADHHYDLGVPADPYANVRKVLPFLPGPPARRGRDDGDHHASRRHSSHRRNAAGRDSRRSKSRHAGRTH